MENISTINEKSVESLFEKEDILKICIIIFGAFLNGFSLNSFLSPFRFLAGGVTGVATLFYFATGIPNYVYLWIFNIPIFIIAFKRLALKDFIISLIGFVSYVIALQISKGLFMPINNMLVSGVLGGLLVGTGTAIAFSQGGTFGGLDVVCFYINKKYKKSLGKANNCINVGILLVLALVYGFETASLTFISMYFVTKGYNSVREWLRRKKTVLVVSDHWKDISDTLLSETKCGVTILNGHGAYSNSQRNVIFFVTKTNVLEKIKELILKKDPSAFITIIDTHDVHGGGFVSQGF